MKTPDEIKKGLTYCVEPFCPGEKCPYSSAESCAQDKTYEAIAYIQQLEAENAEKDVRIQQLEKRAIHLEALNQSNLTTITMQERTRARLQERISQLEAERDAAVRDCGCFPCQTCEERENGDLCPMCEISGGYRSFHQWRGVQKEE